MKQLGILLLFLGFWQISFAQNKQDSSFVALFLKSLQDNSFDSLRPLLPNPEIYRLTSPEETEGKSDEEVLKLAQKPENRLKRDFQKVLKIAQKEQIVWEDLQPVYVDLELLPFVPPMFYSMRVNYLYHGKEAFFVLSVIDYQSTWYLLDIPHEQLFFHSLFEP